jgi:thiol-disulfide isomerase/thioredoxin
MSNIKKISNHNKFLIRKKLDKLGGQLLQKASWRIPCQQLQPIIDELKTDYEDKVNIKFYDAWNTILGNNLAKEYGVTSIPTLIFCRFYI